MAWEQKMRGRDGTRPAGEETLIDRLSQVGGVKGGDSKK